MKILIACERSGIVREAFRARGHDVISCDLEPSLDDSPYHVEGDVISLLKDPWDMVIAFPPCTYLTFATQYNHPKYISLDRLKKQRDAIKLVLDIWKSAEKVCIENPNGWLTPYWKKPSQIFQPYEFGDDVQKRTCFWLKDLPAIYPFFTFPGKPRVLVTQGKTSERKNQQLHPHPLGTSRSGIIRSLFHPKTAARMAELWS